MRVFRPAAILLLAICACLSPAYAASASAGAIEAGVTWQLAFGGHELRTGYDLRLGYRPGGDSPVEAPLVRLSVDDAASVATIAGLPVSVHGWAAHQDAADDAYGAGVATPKPWYARGWVYWTLGGLAASVALSTAGDKHSCTGTCNSCTGTCNQQCADNTVSDCSGSLCVTDGVCGPSGVGTGGYAQRRTGAPVERIAEVEVSDLHGGMGDLIEVAQ